MLLTIRESAALWLMEIASLGSMIPLEEVYDNINGCNEWNGRLEPATEVFYGAGIEEQAPWHSVLAKEQRENSLASVKHP